MIIYLFIFCLSIALYKLSNMFGNKKLLSYFFFILSVIIPCLLAAFRSFEIGTDVGVYVKPLYDYALRCDSLSYYLSHVSIISDTLYLVINFFVAKYIHNISVLLFILELLVVLPIFLALKIHFKNSNAGILSLFIFFFFFYNQSLNIVRQSISISLCVLAFALLEKKNNKKAFILLLISTLIHNTALFSFILYFLYIYLTNNKDVKFKFKKNTVKFVILLSLIILPFFFGTFLSFISKFGLISSAKLNQYLYFMREQVNISYINNLFYFSTFLLLFLFSKKIKNMLFNYEYFSFAAFISIVILQFGSIITYADRIGYYVYYPVLFLALPKVLDCDNGVLTKNKFYYLLLIVVLYVFYWFFWIVFLNYNATIPYSFR